MFRLFQSIFAPDASTGGRYPDELIHRAIERAVDGTDPRLRALPRYHKPLRAAVIHAIDHVVNLVEQLPPPAEISRQRYGTDPHLCAFFASVEHMQEVFGTDLALSDFLATAEGSVAEQVVALLVMEKQERHVFGMDLEGGMLRRDVPQVTVNFADHRLLDPASTETETRRLLKRRAFDHLLSLALRRIVDARLQRAGLEEQRTLLRRKLKALQDSRWGFEEADPGKGPDVAELEAQLAAIEAQLLGLSADGGTLKAHLDILVDVLGRAEEGLWATHVSLIVDRLGVKREQHAAGTLQLDLDELRNTTGRTAIVRLVRVARAALPPRRDLLREAKRYLG
ncbi:MAG: hypothetical protein ACFCVA_02805 [Gammaproteobacteria bacterium]